MVKSNYMNRISAPNRPLETRREDTIEMSFRLESNTPVAEHQIANAVPKDFGGGVTTDVQLVSPIMVLLSVRRSFALRYEDAYFLALASILFLEKAVGRFVAIEGSPRKPWTMQLVLAERHGAFEPLKTDLMKAAGNGELGAVTGLLSSVPTELNKKSLTGHTALCYAVECGHIEVAKHLINSGAEINVSDAEWTIAESALSAGMDILRFLLESGLDPNLQNYYGETALMYAAVRGDKQAVEVLVEFGAVLAMVDETGASAYDWAQRSGEQQIAELLKPHRSN